MATMGRGTPLNNSIGIERPCFNWDIGAK